jgi:hypothetical protein
VRPNRPGSTSRRRPRSCSWSICTARSRSPITSSPRR